VGVTFVNKGVVKTAHKEQGKGVMDVHFVIRVILNAVLWFKDKVLQFKKCVLALCIKAFKRTVDCSC